jgi:predicted ribosome quality control (RQC) complex YloA/Tae2 family protein
MELAKKYGIKNYPTPAGGCALTQEGFTERLKELMKNKPEFDANDVELIKIGRHFWFPRRSLGEGGFDNAQIILGRNQEENEILKNAKKESDIFIIPINFPGPEALIRDKGSSDLVSKTKELIIQFSPKAKGLNQKQLEFTVVIR